MTAICKILLLPFVLFQVSSTELRAQSGSREEKIYELKAANLILKVDGNKGGRIISLKIAETEVLSSSKVHPENYGSTLWISPQSNWGWPPYPVLDILPYRVSQTNKTISLQSMADSLSGCTIKKVISANASDTSITILYTILNTSKTEKKIAPWEVTRVPTGGLTFFPSGDLNGFRESNLVSNDIKGIRWISYNKNTITAGQKMFHDGAEGWLAHVNAGILFVKQFPDNPALAAAPKEAEVEIYVNDLRSYIELENQGKYRALKPGEKLEWQVKWFVRKVPNSIAVVEASDQLIKYVRDIVGGK